MQQSKLKKEYAKMVSHKNQGIRSSGASAAAPGDLRPSDSSRERQDKDENLFISTQGEQFSANNEIGALLNDSYTCPIKMRSTQNSTQQGPIPNQMTNLAKNCNIFNRSWNQKRGTIPGALQVGQASTNLAQ